MIRIRTLIGVAIASALVILLAASFADARPTAAATTTVTVRMKEFKFVLSRKTVPHGRVVFKLINAGRIAHDFKIGTKKSILYRPGKSGRLVVTLARGSHAFKCTVDSHARLGMKGTLRVT